MKAVEEMCMNGTLWINVPSVGFPTLAMDNTCFDVEDSALNPSPHQKAGLEKRRRAKSGKNTTGCEEEKAVEVKSWR